MKCYLLLGLFLALPVQAKTLIEQAYEAGLLDLETALLYQLQAARDPEALPPEYREGPTHPFCGTPLVLQAHQAQAQLGPEYRQRLAKLLARPIAQRELLTPSGHFRVHYDLSGAKAVALTDGNGNDLPDYVDEVVRTLEEVWTLEVVDLGFDPPPTDGNLGGGPEYDVYLVDLGRGGAYGFTYPETGGNTSYSYLELDNDYLDPIYRQTRGLNALHVTVAHEFNHAIQFGYYQGNDGIWWQEATATWMEEVAYPEVDDYLQYVPSFLLQPERALDSGNRFSTDFHLYGAALFAHFLDQHYDRHLIRDLWEEIGRRASANLDHFDRVLRRTIKGGMAEAVSEFAVWNYFTGERHRPGYYREGDKYPAARRYNLAIDINAPKVPVEYRGQVDHLASAFLSIRPYLQSGGVILDLALGRGQWWPQLILVSRDTVAVRPVAGTSIAVPSWEQYEDLVLVLTQTELTGMAFEYSVSAEYDPELIELEPPPIFALKPNFPNPFWPDRHGRTTFPFDLNQPSAANRLSIYAADGRLVWTKDLGPRIARSYLETWDGHNQEGRPVGSGIYYCVLETETGQARCTLAVVRGSNE